MNSPRSLFNDLPLYSYDYDADFPPAGRALKDAIEASDGILLVSPDYNRSIPGALKNAIGWGVQALGHQLVRAATHRHHRSIAGQYWYGRDAVLDA